MLRKHYRWIQGMVSMFGVFLLLLQCSLHYCRARKQRTSPEVQQVQEHCRLRIDIRQPHHRKHNSGRLQNQRPRSSKSETHDKRYTSVNKKDNISITIDSCVYYHIENPHLATFRMNDLVQSVLKVAGGIIKNTISQFTFQELL